MRAALFDRYGPPEVLYAGTVPKPVAKPGEVLVRVRASSVNGGELTGRAGKVRLVTGLASRGFPKRVGVDFTGEVAEVGIGVSGFGRGDRVWGAVNRFGGTAEFVVARPKYLAIAPAGMDLEAAAALPAAGTTALRALRDETGLRKGERLLVRGGSGGVGSLAVQLGRWYGAHVTALAGARHREFVLGLGADEVIDYATAGPADLGRFDVVLDTVGTEFAAYRRLLTPTGRMVSISFDTDHLLRSLGYLAMSTVYGRRRVRFFAGTIPDGLLADLATLTEAGAIRPVVAQTYPLDEIARAHRALEAGGVRGKIVVRVSPE